MTISLNAAEYDRIIRETQEQNGYEYTDPAEYDQYLRVMVPVTGPTPNGRKQWVEEVVSRSEMQPPADQAP